MSQHEQREQHVLLSPCHQAPIEASYGDGVLIGSCSTCGKDVVRVNPRIGKQEWLDGNSPWTERRLRRGETQR